MSAPRVAVAIVHWGTKRDTLRCLRSVRASYVAASPVLVIDNGTGEISAREVRGIVRDAVFIALHENVGFAAAANLAIRHALTAGAQYVMLINNDATLLRDCLGELVRLATTEPRVAAVGAKVLSLTNRKRLWIAYGELTYGAALEIRWPDIPPIVSEKDRVAPPLEAWLADPRSRHFRIG